MKRITFIRHGESVANAGAITMEHSAIPLSDHGHRQAQLIAQHLPGQPSLILVSPMIRTQQTAEPYCTRFNLQPQTVPGLAEFSVICPTLIAGLSGTMRKPFVESYWSDPDPHRRMGPGAETFFEFDARVGDFQAGLDRLPYGTTIFGHGIWFGLLVWHLLGYKVVDASGMRRFRSFQLALPMPNCAVFYLTGGGTGWAIRADESLPTLDGAS